MIKSKSCPDFITSIPFVPSVPSSPSASASSRRSSTVLSAYAPSFQFYSIANAPISSIVTCMASAPAPSPTADYEVATCLATPVESPPEKPLPNVPLRWIQWYLRKKKQKVVDV